VLTEGTGLVVSRGIQASWMATSAGFPKGTAGLLAPWTLVIVDEVANLERGGRLEGVKPTFRQFYSAG
jgi:hypothetical protein